MFSVSNHARVATLLVSAALGTLHGCGPAPKRVSYEPPPFQGKVFEVQLPDTTPKPNADSFQESVSLPKLVPKAQIVVVVRVLPLDQQEPPSVVLINICSLASEHQGRKVIAGQSFAKTTKEGGATRYRAEIKAPSRAGEYMIEAVGPPGESFYGRARLTVVEVSASVN
jgi:hypothetical protein